MKTKKKNKEEEIKKFLKNAIETNMDIEEVKKYFSQLVSLEKVELPLSIFSFPKRTDENFDSREDREDK